MTLDETGTSAPVYRGELRFDEPMSKHTSWRVGGPAKRYFRPADLQDLVQYLKALPQDEELVWLGLGSNLLVRDGGIDGSVIATQGINQALERVGETRVRAEAGVSCAKLAKFCQRHGLFGAEFLAGIPGTVGGALAMNAGAFGGETWNHVVEVETLDRKGRLRQRTQQDYQVGYRHVSLKAQNEEWFIAGLFEFSRSAPAQTAEDIRTLLDRRNASQPIGLPSCGSVFTNPPGDHAARLIEASGLKGHCCGKACVSEKHANFIINTGGATATEIEDLIQHIQDRVADEHGIWLQPEVRIVGQRKQ